MRVLPFCAKAVRSTHRTLRRNIDEFAAMRDLWIREAKGFLLVYAISWASSFDQVKQLFEKIIRIKEEELDEIAIVLAGNKCDLVDQRTVSLEEGRSLVEEWKLTGVTGASFMETYVGNISFTLPPPPFTSPPHRSAKASINNQECYFEIVRTLRKKELEQKNAGGNNDEKGSTCRCNCVLL